MSVASHSKSLPDPWDPQPPSYQPTVQGKVWKSTAEPVPDDWDDDGDEGDDEEPQKVWEDANNRAPMPELVLSASSTTSPAPPSAALQPALRILKRPTPSAPTASAALDSQQKSYAEREAQYQAARQRIFGSDPQPRPMNSKERTPPRKETPSSTDTNSQGSRSPSSTIIRNPKGPESSGDDRSKGFNRRKGTPTNTPN